MNVLQKLLDVNSLNGFGILFYLEIIAINQFLILYQTLIIAENIIHHTRNSLQLLKMVLRKLSLRYLLYQLLKKMM